MGVGKKSSLAAQNNLILWGKFPPLRRVCALHGIWVLKSSFSWMISQQSSVFRRYIFRGHCVRFAALVFWIMYVWRQRYCMFVFCFLSGLLFGREPEKPLVVHRTDIQTARGSRETGGGIQTPCNPSSLFHLHTKRCPAVPSTITRLCLDCRTVTLITGRSNSWKVSS